MVTRDPRRDPRCDLVIAFDRSSLAELKAMMHLETVTDTGCRVIKHPGACVICVRNNDCAKIPLHAQCRCEPQPFLSISGM